MLKHLSLDAWNTILIPNPTYAQVRPSILSKIFHCSEEFAKNIYTSTKREMDEMAAREGLGLSTFEIIRYLISKFPKIDNVEAELVNHYFVEAFLLFPPTILQETIDELKRLRENGVTISVSSNTNFISGTTLGRHIRSLIPFMDFMIFSDLLEITTPNKIGMSRAATRAAKPNVLFFDEVLKHASMLHQNTGFSKENILHIGDSHVCDFIGAASAKFGGSQLIDGPYDLPKVLKEIKV